MPNKNHQLLVDFFNDNRYATACVKKELFSYVRGGGWRGGINEVERSLLRQLRCARSVSALVDAIRIQFMLPFGDAYTSASPYYKWVYADGNFWEGRWEPLRLKVSQVVFENCIVDLETFDVEPHDQEENPIYGPVITAPYNPAATHPDWDDFVERFLLPNPALATYVQRVCSVVLIPHFFVKSALVLVGPSNTGKSTLLAAIAAAPGGFGGQTTFRPDSAATDKFHTFSLLGKFAGVCEEFSTAGKGLEWLKRYTGGQYDFEAKFSPRACGTPTAKLLFASNELPDMTEDSRALFYRLIVVPMTNEIAFGQVDSNRSTPTFWADPGRRAAVLAWLLRGLSALVADGMRTDPPAEVAAAQESVRVETHPVRRYLHENFEETESAEDRVRSSEILGGVREATGQRLSVQRLSALVAAEFPKAQREQRCKPGSKKGAWLAARGYRNLRMKE